MLNVFINQIHMILHKWIALNVVNHYFNDKDNIFIKYKIIHEFQNNYNSQIITLS